ncbi:hypothetical protein T09_4740, partial [Trichinella sp. T9]
LAENAITKILSYATAGLNLKFQNSKLAYINRS